MFAVSNTFLGTEQNAEPEASVDSCKFHFAPPFSNPGMIPLQIPTNVAASTMVLFRGASWISSTYNLKLGLSVHPPLFLLVLSRE